MRYLYLALNWSLGIIFGVLGLLSLVTGDLLPAMPLLAIGALLLPPIRSWAHGKSGIAVSPKARGVSALVLLCVFTYLAGQGEARKAEEAVEQRAQAAAEERAAKHKALLNDFASNKPQILASAQELLQGGELQKVVALGQKYRVTADPDLLLLTKQAETELERKNAETDTARILAELTSIPKHNVEKLAASYTRLATLNPDNKQYAEKAGLYSKQLNEKREADRIAAEKRSLAEVEAAERKKRIEAQFSSWDGSHRNLERIVKEAMNNPDSYQHVKTVYWDKGGHLVVQTTFRGTNAFGGIVPNTVKAKVSVDGDVLQILSQE